MADSSTPPTSPQGNVKLVFVALGVAVLAVVLVNVYIQIERSERREKQITIYRLNRSVRPGDKFKLKDVTAYQVGQSYQKAFGDAALLGEAAENKEGDRFKRSAASGGLLTYRLFTDPADEDPAIMPRSGFRHIPISVNSRQAPGALRPGDFVDIEAPFKAGASMAQVIPIMERVRVIAVGRHTLREEAGAGQGRAVRSFRSITIEVEPQDATLISMIEKLAVGEFELHLRAPGDNDFPKIGRPGINPRVTRLLEEALGQPLSPTSAGR